MYKFDDIDQEFMGQILFTFARDFQHKFKTGKEEHGGRIFDMTEEELDIQELMELLDLVAYKYTRILKRKNNAPPRKDQP